MVGSIMTITCVLLWLPFFLQTDFEQTITQIDHLNFRNSIVINKFVALSITLLLSILNGLFISTFTYLLRITKEKNLFPFNLYLLSLAPFPELHTRFDLQIALFLLIIAIFLLHKIYKPRTPIEEVFQITLCLSFCTMIVPESIIFFPILFLFLLMQRKLSLRVFLSILIGLFVSVSLLFIYFYYSQTWSNFVSHAYSIFLFDENSLTLLQHFALQDILIISFFLVGISAIIHYVIVYLQYTYHTRSTINNLIFIFLLLSPFIIFKINTFDSLKPVWIATLCTFVSNMFIGQNNWFRYVLFYLYIFIQFACYILLFLPDKYTLLISPWKY